MLGISRQAVRQKANGKGWKPVARKGQGGGLCWLYSGLDEQTQGRVSRCWHRQWKRQQQAMTPEELEGAKIRLQIMEEQFFRKPGKAQIRAERRYQLLLEAMELIDGGMKVMEAFAIVANNHEIKPANLRNWYYGTDKKPGVRKLPRHEWLYALMDHYVGRKPSAEITEQAWEYFKALYLHKNKPDLSDCYRRTIEAAPQNEWIVPSERTVRRLVTRVDQHQLCFRRGNDRDFRDILPPQKRDHTCFASGEAVNGDGLHVDLWTVFDDGEVVEHPVMWGWQDIRSSKMLAWRLGKTECTDLIRLSFHDLLRHIKPKHVWSDSTRAAANKLISGNAANRYRFKNREEDGPGLMRMAGIEYHFTNPNHEMSSPGSKPIERAFGKGGIHSMIRNNPRVRGLGTLKNPVPEALLREVIAEEIARFNAREGRRGMGMNGKSFDQVFAAHFSPVQDTISPFMHKLFLLNKETVTIQRNGRIAINAGRGEGKNTYWSTVSGDNAGQKVTVYFDPEDLTKDLHLFRLDGAYIGAAQYEPSIAFISTEEGKKYAKKRASMLKAQKRAAADLSAMSTLEMQQFSKKTSATPMPEVTRKRTQFGNVEVNKMVRGETPDSYAQSVENMNRRIEAMG